MNLLSKVYKITRYSTHAKWIYFIGGILFLEFCTMLVIGLLPPLPLVITALMDCMILTILLTPAVYLVNRKEKKYLKEQQRSRDALKESEVHFYTLANTGQALIWAAGPDQKCNFLNQPWLRFTGRTLEQQLGDGWREGIHPDDVSQFSALYRDSFEKREKFSIEYRLRHSSGDYQWIQNDATPRYNSKDQFIGYIGHCLDITVRKQAETYREVSQEILKILNEPGDFHDLIKRVIAVIQIKTGIEAVGIRLQEGEDFPYYEQNGFPTEFLLKENTLIVRDQEGAVCRDRDNKVCLACTCGLVLSGKHNPGSPLSTPGGSWWTNDSALLLNLAPGEDARFHPRNHCIQQGYASVALVPIRNKEQMVGLIQLNDLSKDRFSNLFVEKLEEIASHIGGALMRKRDEELLRKKDERRLSILETAMDGFWLVDTNGRLLEVNQTYCRMSGYSARELLSMNIADLESIENEKDIATRIHQIMARGEDRFETRHRRKDGSTYDLEISIQYQPVEGGQFITFLHDITKRKQTQKALQESEERVRFKLQSILSPEGSIADLDLNDIIDAPSIQLLMNNFFELAQIPMAIIDISGKVLVGVGWQAICTKFHRVHPQSCAHCIESDVHLTRGIPEGTFKLYKCKNNMWDMATPIIIGGEHKGNLFLGQFFFDNEPIDYQLFGEQAGQYGFPKHEYLQALEGVPRLSQEKLDHAKAFFLKFSQSISQLSYSNIKLARAINQQKLVEETLRENEELLNKAQEIAQLGSWSLDLMTNQLTWSDEIYRIFGLKVQEFAPTYEGFLQAVHPQDREAVNFAFTHSILEGKDHYEMEHRIVLRHSGEIRHVYEKCEHLRDDSGKIVRSVGMVHDITERKVKEEALRKLNQTLAALGKSSKAMVQSEDEIAYLNQVCQIVVDDTDFAMVWIGYAQEDQAKTVRPMASAGFTDNYLETINLRWDDSEWGRGPTGTCIRTGKMSRCNNIHTDPDFEPWREQALKRGFASSIVFPLISEGKTFGAFSIYSKQPDSFLETEINLLSELANDLAQGITTIRLRAAHQLAEKALSKSYNELEALVIERTRELQTTNDLLKKEISLGKQQEQSLKLAEEKYRTVADHTHGWEFWLDKNDHFIYCSPSCERITGHQASEFLNNPKLLLEIIHPEDLDVFRNHKITEDLTPHVHFELEYRIVRADGTIRWIGHECQPIYDETGHFMGVRGSNKDITGRKEMEQVIKTSNRKYRLLSENITDGIFICRNGRFEYVNTAMGQIFGYENNRLIGSSINQLILPEQWEEIEFIYTTSTQVNKLRTLELECLKKDRSPIFVEFLFNYVAKESAIYGVAHDITEKKQLQRNIVKAIILTEEKEKAHFSKELHDGLGPLLSTIKLYLQWSVMTHESHSREEIIGKAEEILEEALTTVKEISNKLSPHLLINHGLGSAIKSFLDKLEDTLSIQIDFDYQMDRRLGGEIEAAAYRALIECVNNTIKHAGAKTITIRLADTGTQLLMQYRDDGLGFNLQETLAVKKGLGLFNLQNRIQNIGGKISLFSEPGKGVDYQIVINL